MNDMTSVLHKWSHAKRLGASVLAAACFSLLSFAIFHLEYGVLNFGDSDLPPYQPDTLFEKTLNAVWFAVTTGAVVLWLFAIVHAIALSFGGRSMGTHFPKLFTVLFATLAAACHIIFIVIPLLTAGPKDWGPAVFLLYADYPLSLFFYLTKLCDPWLNDSKSVWLYCVLGTVMYAAAGALIGYGIDRLRRWRRLSRVHNQSEKDPI